MTSSGSRPIATIVSLAVILSVALGVRLFFALTTEEVLPWSDEREYHLLALEMQHSWAYRDSSGGSVVYWPPGYPYFLAGVYRALGPSISAARVAQAVLGALTCMLLYLIAARLLGKRPAVLAAALAAVYPLTVYTVATLFPATLQTALLACIVYLCVLAKDRWASKGASGQGMLLAVLAGIAAAASALVTPSALPAIILAAVWLAWPPGGQMAAEQVTSVAEGASRAAETPGTAAALSRRGPGRRVILAVVFLLPILMALGGWSYRNYREFGRPIALSANGGFNFWLGNHPEVTATTGNRMTPSMREELGSVYAKYRKIAVRDSVLFDMGLRYAASKPGRFVRLSAAKAVNFWRLYPQPTTEVQPTGGREKLMSLLSYGVLLPFGVVWLFRSLKRSDGARLVLLVFIAYTLVHAVFVSKVRYRLPLDPYIIIYAAGALVALADLVFRRASRRA